LKTDAKKLLDFCSKIPSFKATPGVISSVTPLLTIDLVFFGSSNCSHMATRSPALTNLCRYVFSE